MKTANARNSFPVDVIGCGSLTNEYIGLRWKYFSVISFQSGQKQQQNENRRRKNKSELQCGLNGI